MTAAFWPAFKNIRITGVHDGRPGSYAQTLKSLEQLSKNAICMPRWEGGGGVSISYVFNIHVLLPTPPYYLKSSHSSFDQKLSRFKPH